MLRISTARHGSDTIVRVAGRLQAEHTAELEAQCRAAEGRLVLDLTELQSADRESVRRLLDLAERGARITGPSPYIRLLLERAQEGLGHLPGNAHP